MSTGAQPGASGGGGSKVLAYSEITANVTISANAEASATLIVQTAALTLDGASAIMVEFFWPGVGVAQNEYISLGIFEDGNPRGGNTFYSTTSTGNNLTLPGVIKRRLTPAAGSHVYSARGYRQINNTTLLAGTGAAGQNAPAFIMVTSL